MYWSVQTVPSYDTEGHLGHLEGQEAHFLRAQCRQQSITVLFEQLQSLDLLLPLLQYQTNHQARQTILHFMENMNAPSKDTLLNIP